jgi:hypothetical protein
MSMMKLLGVGEHDISGVSRARISASSEPVWFIRHENWIMEDKLICMQIFSTNNRHYLAVMAASKLT